MTNYKEQITLFIKGASYEELVTFGRALMKYGVARIKLHQESNRKFLFKTLLNLDGSSIRQSQYIGNLNFCLSNVHKIWGDEVVYKILKATNLQ